MVGRRLRLWPLIRLLRRVRENSLWADIEPLLRGRLLLTKRTPKKGNPAPPALFQMAAGYWLSQAIYVAAKLGIADLLTEDPKSSVELAAVTGVDAASLFRVLRALAGVGVFSHIGNDYFALAPLGEGLRTGISGSLRAMLITIGEIHYQACGNLLQSVRTGSPAFNHVFGMGLFDYLRQNEGDAGAFDDGMSNLAAMLSYAVLCAYDFSGIRHIMDIGGGQGTFLRNVLKINPHLRGTVFEMSSTVDQATRRLRSSVYCERLSFVPGDFFVSVPEGADAYLLCGVIHDWDDARAITILKNCRKAMAESGRLLLVEMVVPEHGANCFSKLLDLNMLVMTGGRERTHAEFRRLLNAAGYRLTKVVPTLAPQSIIESVPS
jgi:O-methyltransferase domain/Dimerisation domain